MRFISFLRNANYEMHKLFVVHSDDNAIELNECNEMFGMRELCAMENCDNDGK